MHGGETYTTREAAARLFYESGASVIAMIARGQLAGIRLPGYRSRWRVSSKEVEALRARMLASAARQREDALSAKQLYLDLLD